MKNQPPPMTTPPPPGALARTENLVGTSWRERATGLSFTLDYWTLWEGRVWFHFRGEGGGWRMVLNIGETFE